MSTQRQSRPIHRAALCALPLLLATSAFAVRVFQEEEATPPAATVRAEINAMYDEWGRARVEHDKAALEAMLAPEAYVLLDGQKISREDFLRGASQVNPGVRLTRFDADVLTVQQADEGWTVVITEKVEYAISAPDGEIQAAYGFWVTRDGCRKQEGKWLVTYSEAIGYENWRGARPPFGDW
jgi:hypothetical protein